MVGAFHLDVSVHFDADYVPLLMETVWLLGGWERVSVFCENPQLPHGFPAHELFLY